MKKRRVKILPILIIVGIIAVLVALKLIANRLEVIPKNDPFITGNTPGNLYNGGRFCETEEGLFYANPFDGNSIYFLGIDGKSKKISAGPAKFISVAGDYLYYYAEASGSGGGLGYVRGGRGIHRVKTNGKGHTLLYEGDSDSVVLIGNELYFTSFGDTDSKNNALVNVKSVSITGEDDYDILDLHPVLSFNQNGKLIYSGTKSDHNIYEYDIMTGRPRVILQGNTYAPIVVNEKIYYLDLDDDYKLKVYDSIGGSVETIVWERVDSYNIYGDVIFYQNVDKDGYALKRVRVDGSGLETVYDGVTSNIYCTRDYTYFTLFGAEAPIYKTPTTGPVQVTTFDEASKAAIEGTK